MDAHDDDLDPQLTIVVDPGSRLAVDVLECPDCNGPMHILAAIHPPNATRAILEHLELPSRAPPVPGPLVVDDDAFANRHFLDSL